MSVYQFLSSTMPLEDIGNNEAEVLSIEEAEARGALMPNWYSKDMNISRTEKIAIIVPNENGLANIVIKDDSASPYAKHYSQKPYHAELCWTCSETQAKQLIDYVVAHLQTVTEITLWHIWMDADGSPTIKRCHIDSLNYTILKQFNEQDPYENPQCLIIYR